MKKRFPAMLLAILMFVCLLSTAAFAAADEPTVTANDLVYNGGDQELVSADVPNGYTMYYAMDTEPASTEDSAWVEEVPTAQDAGIYTVWYYAKDADGNKDTESASVQVTITPLELPDGALTVTVSDALTYSGSEQKPTPTVSVTVPGKSLYIRSDNDYTLKYANNLNAGDGTASVTVKAAAGGNYTFHDVTAHFSIAKATMRVPRGSIQLAEESRVYDPDKDTVEVTFTSGEDYLIAEGVNNEHLRIAYLSGSLHSNSAGSQAVTFTFKDTDIEYIDGAKPENYKAEVVFADTPKLKIEKAVIDDDSYTAPTAKKLEANNKKQLLVDPGTSPEGTTMKYRLKGGNWQNGLNNITGKAAGTYTVEYYISGGENYKDRGSTTTPLGSVQVTITSALGSMLSDGSIWIVLAVAVVAVGTVSVLIVRKKKHAKG